MDDRSNHLRELNDFLAIHDSPQDPLSHVDLLVPDMNGILRGKQLTGTTVKKAYTEGVRLPGSNYILDWTGRNIEGLDYGSCDGDPDFFCLAAPGTLKPVPWSKRKSAQVLASMYDADGHPHFADPRNLLQKCHAPLQQIGLTAVVAIEYEFYLLDPGAAATGRIVPAASPRSHWRPKTTNVYSHEDLTDFDDFLGDVLHACKVQGIDADTIVSEYAAGQFEINLHHTGDPLTACDRAIMLERAIRHTAIKHDLLATFMAKPFADQAGSGLHVHVSLLDEHGNNVFAGDMDSELNRPVSSTMRHAIGGLLDIMAQSMAIFAPNANSYRRLRPHNYAPVTGIWGGDNRILSLRIPGGDDAAMRIEHRVSGADANPYLVTAAVLAGIHHGIDNNITPPAPALENANDHEGVALPVRWHTALEAFRAGPILPHYFGKQWCDVFYAARKQECDAHHFTIPPLDLDWYLRTA